ncbi:MAG: hypothetical protein R3277_01470 [Brumimicrobium sp.]|nr:hypothetical protein [Brumimicrobium sp.]
MNRYVDQLLEDLESMIQDLPDFSTLGEDDEDPDEIWMEFEQDRCSCSAIPLSRIVGIEKYILPPGSKLSKVQMELIFLHLEKILSAYGFILDFPEKIQVKVKYELLHDIWEDEFSFNPRDTQIIDFCDFDYDFCPFGLELCRCKQLEEMS